MDVTLRKIEQQQSYQNDTYPQYYWCRRKCEYLTRLFYAITVDIVILSNPTHARKVFVDIRSATLGSYCHSARNMLQALPVSHRKLFEKIWDILSVIKDLRNHDAHPATPPKKLDIFISECSKLFEKLIALTDEQFFSFSKNSKTAYYYLFVPENTNQPESNVLIKCKSITQEGDAIDVKAPSNLLMRGFDKIAGQLYLKVTIDSDNPKYYRISPFINWNNGDPTMFMGTVSFFTDAVMLQQMRIIDNGSNDDLPNIICSTQSFIPETNEKQSNYFSFLIGEGKKHLQINISQYPGYNSITESNFKYCKEICPAVEQAIAFCETPTDHYQIVCGEGGVGKTTLIFYLIHNIIMEGKTNFTRIIFLSAKKYYFEMNGATEHIGQEKELTPDIHNYQEFLQQLGTYLLDKDTEDTDSATLEEALLLKINGKYNKQVSIVSIPTTFLIVDDLDTFSINDQNKVIFFLKQIKKKMYTLVTTRNEKTNGFKIKLDLLDKTCSMTFLKWCIDQEQPGCGNQKCQLLNPDLVYYYTEGRPIELKLWSILITQQFNLPQSFEKHWTKKYKTIYLYQTTLRQLTPEEQSLFYFVCSIDHALYSSKKETEEKQIPLQLLFYLSPDKDALQITKSLHELQDVNLLKADNEYVYVENIDYIEIIEKAELTALPEWLLTILEDMKRTPKEWLSRNFVTRLLQYIESQLTSMKKDVSYECGVLEKLREDKDNLSQKQNDWLCKLLNQSQKTYTFPASSEHETASVTAIPGSNTLYPAVDVIQEQIIQIHNIIQSNLFEDNDITKKVQKIIDMIQTLEQNTPITSSAAQTKIKKLKNMLFEYHLIDFIDY